MSADELLKERYKCTSVNNNHYPGSPYKVGEILIKPKDFNHFRVVGSDGKYNHLRFNVTA